MKIVVISADQAHMQDVCNVLQACGHALVQVDGDRARLRATAELQQPDMILLDVGNAESTDLAQVESVTTQFPGMGVVLLCSNQTPQFLIQAMRSGVREVLASPASARDLENAVLRIEAKLSGNHARVPGKILSFIPCKGGSGATFIATNLGYHLAHGKTVLLIDLNLQFGDALSFVHDGKPSSSVWDVAQDVSRLDASFLANSTVKIGANYSILAAPEDPSDAMGLAAENIDAVLRLAMGNYDFVLLDLSRTLDSIAIKALDRSYRIFPVLQASMSGLRNTIKLLTLFKSLDYPAEKIEVVLNRFEKADEISLDDIQRTLGLRHLRTIPNSYKELTSSINQGTPLAELSRSNTVTKALAEFAHALSPRADQNKRSLVRMFGWT